MIGLYSPAPAMRLALFRAAVGAFAFLYLTTRFAGFTNMTRLEPWQFSPVGAAQLLSAPLAPTWVIALVVLSAVLALSFAVGIAYRVTAPAFALSLLWVTSYRSSWGMLYHTDNLLVLQTLALCVAPAADAFSWDARRRPRVIDEHGRYGWALQVACFVAVTAYFVAGVAKLKLGGFGWLEGEQLRGQIAYDNLRKVELGRTASELGVWFVRHPQLFPPLAVLTLIVELGAPLALLHRRIALLWALSAFGFHVGVALLMNIKFPYPLSFVPFLAFFRVERWHLTWLGKKLRARWPFLAAAVLCSGCCQPPRLPSQRASIEPDPYGPIIVVGDTQRTACLESIGREQNEDARRQLVSAIAQGPRPSFIVHLGDMVAQGDSAAEWEYFRALVSPLRRVPTYPVLGNHDLWGDRREALALAVEQYPVLATRFYARRFRGLGLIWLDSNLDGYQGRAQAQWLRHSLDAFDADEGTRAVLVFTHHPAFTDGIGRHPEPYVVDYILPAFRRSTKALVLFSGHVHGYERFEEQGKTYVVTGGGGGPRVAYRASSRAAYPHRAAELSPFHYLALEVEPEGLQLSARCAAVASGCNQGLVEPPVRLAWPRVNLPSDQSGSDHVGSSRR